MLLAFQEFSSFTVGMYLPNWDSVQNNKWTGTPVISKTSTEDCYCILSSRQAWTISLSLTVEFIEKEFNYKTAIPVQAC